ncbi:uncharacterized protein BDCG_06762 [Blastomyces dermatitidis ER-3]|uniref:Uncharacterized protein n=1 Tax=Ajellomyces dermatitidis (strain ER-3 / ATCC MYA-2586) TaxID=559297 RepID=A0ABP2F721_AJEDR|nr:uncharacterized protein BDCG_06762 [Blastomyces dermatitidis ER-3]EEQ91642.2 hypothetical protein BDCG_06762 [Blastomyces dermatitidis ER-3]
MLDQRCISECGSSVRGIGFHQPRQSVYSGKCEIRLLRAREEGINTAYHQTRGHYLCHYSTSHLDLEMVLSTIAVLHSANSECNYGVLVPFTEPHESPRTRSSHKP